MEPVKHCKVVLRNFDTLCAAEALKMSKGLHERNMTVTTEEEAAKIGDYKYIQSNINSPYIQRQQEETIKSLTRMVNGVPKQCTCKLSNGKKCCGSNCSNRKYLIACDKKCGEACYNNPKASFMILETEAVAQYITFRNVEHKFFDLLNYSLVKFYVPALVSRIMKPAILVERFLCWDHDRFLCGKATYVKAIGVKGYGLFASKLIAENEFIGEYVGEVITAVADLPGNEWTYDFEYRPKEYCVNAYHAGNSTRFINHACNANCEAVIYIHDMTYKILLKTIKKINANEEFTLNYQWSSISTKKAKPCYCRSDTCKGYIGSIADVPQRKGFKEKKSKNKTTQLKIRARSTIDLESDTDTEETSKKSTNDVTPENENDERTEMVLPETILNGVTEDNEDSTNVSVTAPIIMKRKYTVDYNKLDYFKVGESYVCKLCGYVSKGTSLSIQKHVKRHSQRFNCSRCNAQYRDRRDLDYHRKKCKKKVVH